MRVLLLVTALALPQQRPAPAPAASAPRAGAQADPLASAGTAYDSTVAAITDVGTKVASVKATSDLLRRSSFNDSPGTVLERARMLRRSCEDLAAATQRAGRVICRSCTARDVQPVVERYRMVLPTLTRLGRQCATRVQRWTTGGSASDQAQRVRSDVRALSRDIVAGFTPYEQRLQEVREVFGWAARSGSPTPRAPAPRTAGPRPPQP